MADVNDILPADIEPVTVVILNPEVLERKSGYKGSFSRPNYGIGKKIEEIIRDHGMPISSVKIGEKVRELGFNVDDDYLNRMFLNNASYQRKHGWKTRF